MFSLFTICAPDVHPETMNAIVAVESGYNPYAIGVVGGSINQPKNLEDALAAVDALLLQNKNFSVGLGQINRFNLERWRIEYKDAFDPCKNLGLAQKVLTDCFGRAIKEKNDQKWALLATFSCYYSNNFRFGFKSDFIGQLPYVDKIINAKDSKAPIIPAIGNINPNEFRPTDLPPKINLPKRIKKTIGSDRKFSKTRSSSNINNGVIF